MSFSENSMYIPIRQYFESMGYNVRSEVKGVDIVLYNDVELVAVEMKKSMNLTLLLQAADRQSHFDYVYIAVPRPKSQRNRTWLKTISLLKRLNIGIITVSMDTQLKYVDIIYKPVDSLEAVGAKPKTKSKKKKALIEKELKGRTGEYNEGGVTKKKIVTAFREKVIRLSVCFEQDKTLSVKELKEMTGIKNVSEILRKNYYGWFDAVEKGLYKLNSQGKSELKEFEDVVSYYRQI